MTEIEVLEREKQCVQRKAAINCSDCAKCDLLMDDAVILAAYERAINAIRQQETVANRNGLNEPLTLDELRKMDGEPVYCVEITGREEWLFRRDSGFADMYGEFTSDDFMVWDNYGKLWWCYRRKPEEDGHDERKEKENA